MTWAKSSGKRVAESEWKASTTSDLKNQQFGGQNSGELYDLKGAHTTK